MWFIFSIIFLIVWFIYLPCSLYVNKIYVKEQEDISITEAEAVDKMFSLIFLPYLLILPFEIFFYLLAKLFRIEFTTLLMKIDKITEVIYKEQTSKKCEYIAVNEKEFVQAQLDEIEALCLYGINRENLSPNNNSLAEHDLYDNLLLAVKIQAIYDVKIIPQAINKFPQEILDSRVNSRINNFALYVIEAHKAPVEIHEIFNEEIELLFNYILSETHNIVMENNKKHSNVQYAKLVAMYKSFVSIIIQLDTCIEQEAVKMQKEWK